MKIGSMLGITFAMTLMTSPPARLCWTALGDIVSGAAYAQDVHIRPSWVTVCETDSHFQADALAKP
jgi:hypothetical protein